MIKERKTKHYVCKEFSPIVIDNIEKLKIIMKRAYIEGEWPNYSEKDNKETKTIGKNLIDISGTKKTLVEVINLINKETKYCTGYLEFVWDDLIGNFFECEEPKIWG